MTEDRNIDWNDREAVLSAMQEDGSALEYAPEALRDDREVVLACLV